MDMQKIRNALLGLLITGLLAGFAQDALAQRNRASDVKRPVRNTLKTDKIVKQSGKQRVRKNHTSKPAYSKAMYRKNENRKKAYGHSKRDWKSYKKNRKHAYVHSNKKRHYPAQRAWQHNHYRKPVWVDYRRPRYRYPRIGMHVSMLPHGFISLRIGKLRFYAYQGVYYRYNPALRVYVVVNKPRIEYWHTSVTWDRITLVDGSTIEGIYRSSDNDMILFEVGDALLEIPMSEIKMLSLSEN